MALRLVITDALWAELESVLRTLKHYAGSPPQLRDRLFIEAVLYQARTGIHHSISGGTSARSKNSLAVSARDSRTVRASDFFGVLCICRSRGKKSDDQYAT
jgi:hypothetical protein